MNQIIHLRPWDPPRGDPPGTLEETRSVREVFGVAHPPPAPAGLGDLCFRGIRGRGIWGLWAPREPESDIPQATHAGSGGRARPRSPDPPVTAGLPRAPGTREGVCHS